MLYQTAQRGDFDFYLSPAEASSVPKAWQGKPIYRDLFGSAAGRVFLACVEPARLVLFMELRARFAAARQSERFQQGLAMLSSYHTSQGVYRFPSSLLAEKTGYYIYSGSHMGMGEDRHSPQAMELESTFRMLTIQKRMQCGEQAG